MSQTTQVVEHQVLTNLRAAVTCLGPGAGGSPGVGWQLGDAEVEAGIEALFQVESMVAGVRTGLLEQAEVRTLGARTQADSVQRWLGDRFRVSRGQAAGLVRDGVAYRRHPAVLAALGAGSVSVEQAGVITTVLDRIVALPQITQAQVEAAAKLLITEAAALVPADLGRAGQALVEALTVAPTPEDPAEAAAVEREHRRGEAAEARAQEAERSDLHVTHRRGRLRAVLDLGTIGEVILTCGYPKPGPRIRVWTGSQTPGRCPSAAPTP